jgi:hypothetical protein
MVACMQSGNVALQSPVNCQIEIGSLNIHLVVRQSASSKGTYNCASAMPFNLLISRLRNAAAYISVDRRICAQVKGFHWYSPFSTDRSLVSEPSSKSTMSKQEKQPELQEGEKVAWKFGAGKAVGHVDHKLTEPTQVPRTPLLTCLVGSRRMPSILDDALEVQKKCL